MSLKELLSQTGGKSASFGAIGDTITGQVIAADVRQTKNFQTGELETWDDGNPRQQVVITLSTDLRDAADPDDDGTRSVYIKWWGPQRAELLRAIKAAGAEDVEPGGFFTATYVGDGEQKQRGFNPPKLYRYEYEAPKSAIAQAVSSAQPGATQQQPAAPTPPAATPAVSPEASMDKIATLIKASMTDQQVAELLNVGIDAVKAVRASMATA